MTVDADHGLIPRIALSADSFNPVERRTMVSDTTGMLKQMIIDGRLRPGDRLPPERVLCEALQVSRPTLREAIRSLDAMKILNALPGAGTFVSSLQMEDLLEPMQFALALSKTNLDQLFEIRCSLEPDAAALAALRATEEDIEALLQCVEKTRLWRDDLDELLVLDVELHRLVVQATHNGIYMNVMASLRSLAYESRSITIQLPGVAQCAVDDHVRIGVAISKRDVEGSRKAMLEHLQQIRSQVQSSMLEKKLGSAHKGDH